MNSIPIFIICAMFWVAFFYRVAEVSYYRRKVWNFIADETPPDIGLRHKLIFIETSEAKMVLMFWRNPASFFPKELTDLIS